MRRWLSVFMLLSLLCGMMSMASSETLDVSLSFSEIETTGASDSYVRCPLFTSDSDPAKAAKINAMVQETACVQAYMGLLSAMEEGSTGLQMDYRMTPSNGEGDILSLVFSAEGKMLTGRPSQAYYPMVIDTRTDSLVSVVMVFTDVSEAEAAIEEYIDMYVAPQLSTHLENSDLLPVPMERFSLDETGITFYYEVKQLSFLSGYAGSITIPYHALRDVLNLENGSVLNRMGIADRMLKINDTTKESILKAAESGKLGALPAKVGQNLEEALDVFRSTTDAFFYPGGSCYEVEEAALRDAYLITDENEETVTGIYARDVSLFGLVSGLSTREEWTNVLGQPDFSMELAENAAQQYMLCAGVSDYYDIGEYTLMLHADENGVLYACVLSN